MLNNALVEHPLRQPASVGYTPGMVHNLPVMTPPPPAAFSPHAALASYFPRLVVERVLAHPERPEAPAQETFMGAVLFADIAGFSTLADQLAHTTAGRRGAEEVTHLLNTYFGQVIDLITAHGGDVFEFAGDALVAVWRAKAGQGPAVSARQAAQCALNLQQQFHNYAVAPTVQLSLHIGVAAGTLAALQIGGVFGRWKWLLSGAPMAEVGLAEQHAAPGHVVVAPNTWVFLQGYCVGKPLVGGYMLLQDVRVPTPTPPLSPLTLPAGVEEAMRAFLPGAVLTHLNWKTEPLAISPQPEWLAELRRVTVVFLNLPTRQPQLALTPTHTALQTIQALVYRYEGSLNNLFFSEHGLMVVAAWGLPPLAHEDDPVRGVQAALALVGALQGLGLNCALGVTTGYVFCGAVGNHLRREYAIIGDVVNLAARLMQAAAHLPPAAECALPVVCDAATYQAAQKRILFEKLAPTRVKGKSDILGVYRPQRERPTPTTQTQLLQTRGELLGRQTECATLASALHQLARHGQGGVVVVEGDAGLGKTSLLQYVRRQATTLRLTTYALTGNALEQAAPYQAWRPVFSQMLDLEVLAEPEARRQHVLNILEFETEQDWQALAPLLNVVLPLGLPESPITAALIGPDRAQRTRALLWQLLQTAAQLSSRVILVEDAHWLDSASWQFLASISKKLAESHLLLVVALRPWGDEIPAAYTTLLQQVAPNHHLRLEPLSALDSLTLIQRQLGVLELSASVASWIVERAEGNPYFCEELALTLRDMGLLTAEGRATPMAEAEPLDAQVTSMLQALNLPDTFSGTITYRLDRLSPPQQLTLKVASVIGRTFSEQVLREIYPMQTEVARLAQHLTTLVRLNFISCVSEGPEATYTFKHVFIQEAAYNLMLFAQRRELHQRAAWAIERLFANRLPDFYGALGMHFLHGELWEQAANYLALAGDSALRLNAQAEAQHFYTTALEALVHLPLSVTKHKQQSEMRRKLDRLG